jgi:ribose/xylose/arabinose/galactoside ABC-type transport system permease subunit
VILALVAAALLGSVNGLFTAYVGIPSFVATLAMLFFLDGLALILSHSQQISTPGTSVTHTGTFASIFGRRDVFRADLGAGDHGHPSGRVVVHALGDLHGGDWRQPRGRG